MGNYDMRVDGPTKGGCTREAYMGGGIRTYIGAGKRDAPNRELPEYLAPLDEKVREQTKNQYIELPTTPTLEGMPSYLSKPISKGLSMVGQCRGTCRSGQGCSCK